MSVPSSRAGQQAVQWLVIIALAAILTAWKSAWRWVKCRQRRRAAQALGFQYVGDAVSASPEPEFQPIAFKGDPDFFSLMRRQEGRLSAYMFDLEFDKNASAEWPVRPRGLRGALSGSIELVAALFKDPDAALPIFMLVPSRVEDAKRVGIDLPFLEGYALLADDKAAAADLFLTMPSDLLSLQKGWIVEGGGRWIVMCRRKGDVRGDMKAFFETAQRSAKALFGQRR